MLKKSLLFVEIFFLVCLSCLPSFAQRSLTVMGVWTGAEADAFLKMVAPF